MHNYYVAPFFYRTWPKWITVPYSVGQAYTLCPPKRKKESIKPQHVIMAVCSEINLPSDRLFRHRRIRKEVLGRQFCWRIFIKHLGYTLKQAGDVFEGYDHTSVHHSMQTIQNHIDTEPDLLQQLNRIEQSLQLPLTAKIK